MASVVFLTRTVPSEIGPGGKHRAYQILYDLEVVLGRGNVRVLQSSHWRSPSHRQGWKRRRSVQITGRLLGRLLGKPGRLVSSYIERPSHYRENPYKFLAPTAYTTDQHMLEDFSSDYESAVEQMPDLVACIIDDSRLSAAIAVNLRHGIPTIGCFQNLESFDQASSGLGRKWEVHATAIDFANEFRVLARCRERLFISKVETGLISGLGLHSHYYPYLPVGKIRQRLQETRCRRESTNAEDGLFLMLGSAIHATTRESFAWFLRKAKAHGLPKGVRIVVGGQKTDQLLPVKGALPGVEIRGWLEQEELDSLMLRVRAILAPQRRGFGALTRLSELSCAGVPVLVSKHASYAIDLPPGVHIVDDSWNAWYAGMERFAGKVGSQSVPIADYYAWETRQQRTLQVILGRVLEDL